MYKVGLEKTEEPVQIFNLTPLYESIGSYKKQAEPTTRRTPATRLYGEYSFQLSIIFNQNASRMAIQVFNPQYPAHYAKEHKWFLRTM